MPKENILEVFKNLNASKFAKEKMGKSQSWLAHKINGTDSKGGFDASEYKMLSKGLRDLISDLEAAAQYCDEQAEDKSLLINILKDE
jgi:hypothetical protein